MSNVIDEVIEKVKKLHRLASCKGATPDESALAAARAQEIIDRYKLNWEDLNGETDTDDDEEVEKCDVPLDEFVHNWLVTPWAFRLANIVCRFNQCEVIQYTRQQNNGKTYPIRSMKIIGHASDVTLVRYLYGYLKQEVLRLDKVNCQGKDGKWRRAFCIGVVDTIYQKLHEQQQATQDTVKNENAGNLMALVRIDKAIARLDVRKDAVTKFIKENLKTKKCRTGACQTDDQLDLARLLGRVAGTQIQMTRAIASIGA